MTFYDQYTETNMVRSLVIYDWSADFDIAGARDIFDRIAHLMGRPPDIATVVDGKKGKDYPYRNFVKRDIIHQKNWLLLGYLWKRSASVLSDFAIDVACDIKEFRRFEIHIDEAAVDAIDRTFERIVDLVTNALQPIYGIGYQMPYYWGPRAFANGTVSSRFATVDKTLYGPPERLKEQSSAFGYVYLSSQRPHLFGENLRDLFEINFLSKGHLDRQMNGKRLQDWIKDNAFGALRQLTSTTWRWDVPHADIQQVRKTLIEAGLTIVKA